MIKKLLKQVAGIDVAQKELASSPKSSLIAHALQMSATQLRKEFFTQVVVQQV
jgi:hypothetical protein